MQDNESETVKRLHTLETLLHTQVERVEKSLTEKWVKLGNDVDRFECSYTHMCIFMCIQVERVEKSLTDVDRFECTLICMSMYTQVEGVGKSMNDRQMGQTRRDGGLGSRPKKCTGRDWGMGSSTI